MRRAQSWVLIRSVGNRLDDLQTFRKLEGLELNRFPPGSGAMSAKDIFADAAELEPDLVMLENLRWARKEFVDRICEGSGSRDEDVLTTLRLEATYQLA